MRRVEYLREGIPALLHEAEKSPVTITYRGVNDCDKKLYEAKSRAGEVIADKATEKELFEALVAREQAEKKGTEV